MPRWTVAPIAVRNPSHSLRLTPFTLHFNQDRQPTKRNGVILSLDVAAGLANVGKEASSMISAPAILGVTTVPLTTIGVSSIPSVNEAFQAQTQLGQVGQQTGLRGPQDTLRRIL